MIILVIVSKRLVLLSERIKSHQRSFHPMSSLARKRGGGMVRVLSCAHLAHAKSSVYIIYNI